MSDEKLSLVNLEGGAAVEMFDIVLQKVLENIHDINTTADAREITLKVKVKPMDENRSIVVYTITCPAKTCGQEPVRGVADLKIEGGRLIATGRPQKQDNLPFANVASINKHKE